MDSLASDPFQEGSDVARDSSGREYQIRVVGKLVVYYWVDHAEKEVRIVDVVDADTAPA